MSEDKILIKKAGGQTEAFDIEKLRHSLDKSRASKDLIEKVTSHIINELEEGMSTHDIYSHAFDLLHRLERPVAIRYSMRRALLALGPTGFPFERFIAEIFKSQGYETLTDQIIKGRCVEHEVDVVGWKSGPEPRLIMSEVKFHNELGLKSDLKVVLYVKARFEDLAIGTFNYGGLTLPLGQGYLVTNTKFTISALKYAECQTMQMIGWNYPLDGNLQDLIERANLHPLTCLRSLSEHDKKTLIGQDVILCSTLKNEPDRLENIGLTAANIEAILEEIKLLDS